MTFHEACMFWLAGAVVYGAITGLALVLVGAIRLLGWWMENR